MRFILKKIILTIILILPITWLALQLYLPFGNHFLVVGHFSGENRNNLSIFQKIYISPFISKNIIKIKGHSCDVHTIDIIPFSKSSFPNASILMSIETYDSNKKHLDDKTKNFIRKIIRDLIRSCNPNLGPEELPPIVAAIVSEESEFVEWLLSSGADPLMTFTTPSGNKSTPFRVAERFAELEAERLIEDPNHPKATGQAKIILDIINDHIENGDLDAQFQLAHKLEQRRNYERTLSDKTIGRHEREAGL